MTGPAEASKHDCSGTEDRPSCRILVEGVGKAFEQRRDRALAGRIAGGTIGEQDDWHTVVIAVLSASEAESGAGRANGEAAPGFRFEAGQEFVACRGG